VVEVGEAISAGAEDAVGAGVEVVEVFADAAPALGALGGLRGFGDAPLVAVQHTGGEQHLVGAGLVLRRTVDGVGGVGGGLRPVHGGGELQDGVLPHPERDGEAVPHAEEVFAVALRPGRVEGEGQVGLGLLDEQR
jgi:hypothetical protein